MDSKSIKTLEFPKILDQLAAFTAFSASEKLARSLRPSNQLLEVKARQALTTEATLLLSAHADISIGGARDIRPMANLAERGGVLMPEDLMEIKDTLVASRDLFRFFNKILLEVPGLKAIGLRLQPPEGLIEAISRVLDEKGEIRDSASEKLSAVRGELKNANHRVMDKLNAFINAPSTGRMLQEAIITKRGERYVVPLKAEYKGRIKCVVQDQSASGATLFVEPMAVVELNNARISLAKEEKDEIQRILSALSALVGSRAEEVHVMVADIAALDLALACAKYAFSLDAVEPVLNAFPEERHDVPDPIMRLLHARHPLLDEKEVVPIDILLEKGTFALVITGPNTGGKTVSLKTAGLLALMAQAGLHIPALSGSELCVFTNIFADIGDEQSIEQSLSTFSGHVTNIVRLLKRAGRRTLVLLDELGAGTDPQEGSALARAILAFMMKRQTPCLVATHYPELKAFAHDAEGVRNASVEFDPKSLRPTYRLLIGIPGRSNALAIASRLGISDEILDEARGMVDPQEMRADDLLDDIHRQLDLAREESARAEKIRVALEQEKRELRQRLAQIEEERVRVLESAQQDAAQELEQVYEKINAIKAQAEKSTQTDVKKELRKKADQLKEKIQQPIEKQRVEKQPRRPLRTGDRVYLRRLDTLGVVTEIANEEIEVQIGKMRMRADLRDVERADSEKPEKIETVVEERAPSKEPVFHPSPGNELKLLGMRAEDALLALERYLDSAQAAGLPYVRIVHGKGSGVLRQVVRENLPRMHAVKYWEEALQNEGGEGVTVAFLDQD
jgi:DNA mismatch repair protein MutS2